MTKSFVFSPLEADRGIRDIIEISFVTQQLDWMKHFKNFFYSEIFYF